MFQGQYRRDFAGYATANERTDGAGSAPVRGIQITRRLKAIIRRSKRKTAKLLQQSGGTPRFEKHSSHLCSV